MKISVESKVIMRVILAASYKKTSTFLWVRSRLHKKSNKLKVN